MDPDRAMPPPARAIARGPPGQAGSEWTEDRDAGAEQHLQDVQLQKGAFVGAAGFAQPGQLLVEAVLQIGVGVEHGEGGFRVG